MPDAFAAPIDRRQLLAALLAAFALVLAPIITLAEAPDMWMAEVCFGDRTGMEIALRTAILPR